MDMIRAVGSFLSELNMKAWAGLAIVVLILGLLFMVFRLYSGDVLYNQIQQEIHLLRDLQEVGTHSTIEQDSTVRALYHDLTVKLHQAVVREPGHVIPLGVSPRIGQALVALIPWFLIGIGLAYMPGVRTGRHGRSEVIAGVAMVSFMFAFAGALMPPSWPTWVRYLLYPFGGSILLFWFFAWKGGRDRAQERASPN